MSALEIRSLYIKRYINSPSLLLLFLHAINTQLEVTNYNIVFTFALEFDVDFQPFRSQQLERMSASAAAAAKSF